MSVLRPWPLMVVLRPWPLIVVVAQAPPSSAWPRPGPASPPIPLPPGNAADTKTGKRRPAGRL